MLLCTALATRCVRACRLTVRACERSGGCIAQTHAGSAGWDLPAPLSLTWGHMQSQVPMYKPAAAYTLYEAFLNDRLEEL